jgi:hypothetical protein
MTPAEDYCRFRYTLITHSVPGNVESQVGMHAEWRCPSSSVSLSSSRRYRFRLSASLWGRLITACIRAFRRDLEPRAHPANAPLPRLAVCLRLANPSAAQRFDLTGPLTFRDLGGNFKTLSQRLPNLFWGKKAADWLAGRKPWPRFFTFLSICVCTGQRLAH